MNTPSRFWNTIIALAGVLIALVAVLIIKELKSIAYVGTNPTMTNTINVEGTGESYAKPDIATFSFTVTQNAGTVTDAQTKADTQANAAIKAVKDAGVSDADIQTTSYSINPHYEYRSAVCQAGSSYCPGSKQVLTGYDVSESVSVKIRDLAKAGSIFTSIGSLGVQNVDGLSFSLDKPDSVQADARAKAIADAQSKAQTLAKQLGVSLVRVISFSESNGGRPIYYAMDSAKAMSTGAAVPAVAPDIATGQQKVSESVQITYEIQ